MAELRGGQQWETAYRRFPILMGVMWIGTMRSSMAVRPLSGRLSFKCHTNLLSLGTASGR
jgi:hypothetical protein